MNSQFNLQENASFSTSPFKPSKSSQMSPFQGHGNTQSSLLSHLLNNNAHLLGNNNNINNGNSNFLNLNHPAASSVLIHPSNHLKCSNNQFGGNKSNRKDNSEESVSLVASYAQYISNFESSLQPFQTASNADSNNQYFQNFYHAENGNFNSSNHLNSQSFSFGGSSPFVQNNNSHQITNHHNHNSQQTPQNHKRSQYGGSFEEGFGNTNTNNSNPLLSLFASDKKKLPMEHLSWLEKKTLTQQVPQKTINSKRKRDTLLPPSTAASSMNDAEGSSSKIPKKVAVERGSALSILVNASGSSQQKDQLSNVDDNKVRTRGGLIEQMKQQRQQILQKEADCEEEDIVKKKNKKTTKKISETIREIYAGEKSKKQLHLQENNLDQAKKWLFQRKQAEQLEKHNEKVSQKRETINGKKDDNNDVDIDDVEISIEKDYEGLSMRQHGKQQYIQESNSDELNVKSEEEIEEQSQKNDQENNDNHNVSKSKSKRTYQKLSKTSTPIEQMNPEKIEKETSSAAQRAHEIQLDEHVRSLLEEAECLGRVYSLIGSCVGGLVTQIRQQYLDQQLLSAFASRNQQMNPQAFSQKLSSEIHKIPFLGQKTKSTIHMNKSKNPTILRQSKP